MAMIKCNKCGKQISDKAKKCPHCGNMNSVIICPECGEIIKEKNIKICPNCGMQIKKKNAISKNKEIFFIILITVLIIIIFFIILSNSSKNDSSIAGTYINNDDYQCVLKLYENGTCYVKTGSVFQSDECTYDVNGDEVFIKILKRGIEGLDEDEYKQATCTIKEDEIYCSEGLLSAPWVKDYYKQ